MLVLRKTKICSIEQEICTGEQVTPVVEGVSLELKDIAILANQRFSESLSSQYCCLHYRVVLCNT